MVSIETVVTFPIIDWHAQLIAELVKKMATIKMVMTILMMMMMENCISNKCIIAADRVVLTMSCYGCTIITTYIYKAECGPYFSTLIENPDFRLATITFPSAMSDYYKLISL
jgi:hypothetical protein